MTSVERPTFALPETWYSASEVRAASIASFGRPAARCALANAIWIHGQRAGSTGCRAETPAASIRSGAVRGYPGYRVAHYNARVSLAGPVEVAAARVTLARVA
jgi:hypothetical protein